MTNKQSQIAAPGDLKAKAKSTTRTRFARKPKQKEEQQLLYGVCSCTGINNYPAALTYGLMYCDANNHRGMMSVDQIRLLQSQYGNLPEENEDQP